MDLIYVSIRSGINVDPWKYLVPRGVSGAMRGTEAFVI